MLYDVKNIKVRVFVILYNCGTKRRSIDPGFTSRDRSPALAHLPLDWKLKWKTK